MFLIRIMCPSGATSLTRGLLFQKAGNQIKRNSTKRVCLVQSRDHLIEKKNTFISPLYGWKIAHYASRNNRSLTDVTEQKRIINKPVCLLYLNLKRLFTKYTGNWQYEVRNSENVFEEYMYFAKKETIELHSDLSLCKLYMLYGFPWKR